MHRVLNAGCLLGLAALSLLAQPPAGPPHGWSGGSRFAFMGFGPDMSTPVTGAPYSAAQVTTFTQKLADGNTIQHSEQANVYRDSQGRVRLEHNFSGRGSAGSKSPSTAISIFDPVAGYSYMLQPNSQKAVQSVVRPRPAADAARSGHGPGRRSSSTAAEPQTLTENLGTQTINGVAATGTRSTQTIPSGAIGNTQQIQIVREVWISQDLKVPVMIKTSDPRFGETTMQLTRIVQANPDASLFLVPSGYTIESAPARPSGHMWPPNKGSNR